MRVSLFLAALASVLVAACAEGSTTFTPNGPAYPPRGSGCDFAVYTAPPEVHFHEVGVIDLQPGFGGANVHKDIASLKTEIAPKVCAAGGDAVIAFANGYGWYMKATVLKLDASPPAEKTEADTSAGCRFDTQCKGDRICAKGACVDPPSKAK